VANYGHSKNHNFATLFAREKTLDYFYYLLTLFWTEKQKIRKKQPTSKSSEIET
jgi:hypothetical protein